MTKPESTDKPTAPKKATKSSTESKHPHGNFPYNFVPATEKVFGCCSQRAGCITIGVGQIILGALATGFQVVLAVMARGGVDLTKIFGDFPKDESVKKFIFGVSVVDIFAKVIFIVSGIIIIWGAVKEKASLLNAWMCINSYTFASSIATNAAAAGGLISFADSREEYALPLTFDTILMGAQYYVMTIVKGYHKRLVKAEENLKNALQNSKDGDKGIPVDDHDLVHSSIKFKCWKCCSYEEQVHKEKKVDHIKAWKEAEIERRISIKAHAAEAEQKRLMDRALDAERRYERLLLRQAVRDEQERRSQNQRSRQGPMRSGQPPRITRPPNPPPGPPGYRGIPNPNARPSQLPMAPVPPRGWSAGRPPPPVSTDQYQRPQGPPPGPSQPQQGPMPQNGKRPTDPFVNPPQGQSTRPSNQQARPNPSAGKNSTSTAEQGQQSTGRETTKAAQDSKTKKPSEQPKLSTQSGGTFTVKPMEHDQPSPGQVQPEEKRLSEPSRKSQALPGSPATRKRGSSK